MIFYEKATWLSLILVSIPAIAAAYFHFARPDKKTGIVILVSAGFLLRLLMITLDPYLHEWDERYHALVAKHMIGQPFKPMLFLKHILPYNPEDWGYSHIWVHKQPLFLWQMALSMKVFGVHILGLRLTSVIMSTAMIWLTYDLVFKWFKDHHAAFIAAFISCFSYYILELTSGLISLDHNDLAFTFYMTCCFWAFTQYVHSAYKLKWTILIGLFAGLSILNKWLVGLLIFGGWGLYLLQLKFDIKKYIHLVMSLIVACIVFVPWQIYILDEFPSESAIAFEYNKKHMIEDLGHPGDDWFHFRFLTEAYHEVLLGFLIIGILVALIKRVGNFKMTLAFLAMMIVIFSFFSFFVATKMPAFVFPVSVIMIGFMSLGVVTLSKFFIKGIRIQENKNMAIFLAFTLLAGVFAFKPWKIAEFRSADNHYRNNKIYNNQIYRNFEIGQENYVILNTRAYENIELMFYQDFLAYHWYPSEHQIDSLQNIGYKFAAFQFPVNDNQTLPQYILSDKDIIILPFGLK